MKTNLWIGNTDQINASLDNERAMKHAERGIELVRNILSFVSAIGVLIAPFFFV